MTLQQSAICRNRAGNRCGASSSDVLSQGWLRALIKRTPLLPPPATSPEGAFRMSDLAERVKKIVVEHLDVDAAKVEPKASFIDDLGADSLDIVELVMAFEEEFDVEIPDDAAETIQTVGDAIKFISEQKG
jgi:acyl carrier protein